jgi:RND family efflux transporter MFP subunit
VQAAKAQLARGRLDLERCHVRLPFAGRVRSVHADIGQTVQRGQRLAVVLDTSALEVRLPIPLDEAGFADLPLEQSREDGPGVELSATFGGERATWRGRVVRIEGELDRRTRQLTAIARVPGDGGAPLLVGMFVDAVITGRDVPKVVSVPRAAVTARGELWLVEGRTDDDGRTTQHLRRRAVEILRRERDRVLIESGVAPGEQICVTSMQAPVDGMLVRVDPDQALVERAR